jgi:hypothetical protein
LDPEFSTSTDEQIRRLYRRALRRHRRGEAGALRYAARCRLNLIQRRQFREWLSWNHSRLPH